MNNEEEPELEIAEEADLSLNPSLADSQSVFGDSRYRDFEDQDAPQKVSLMSRASSPENRFDDSDEPRLKYDRLASDLKEILERDSASAVTVNDKFIVVGKYFLKVKAALYFKYKAGEYDTTYLSIQLIK